MKLKTRIVGWGLVGLLWLGIPWLGLEFYAAISTWWENNHNPYILSARGFNQYPHDLDRPPAGPLPDIVPDTTVTWDSWRSAGPPEPWAIPVTDETDPQAETRRQAFPALSEEDRDYFASLHNDLVCMFDAEGTLVRRYGNWTRPWSGDLEAFCEQALASGDSDYRELHIDDEAWGVFRFYFVKGPDGSSYGFLNVEKMLLAKHAQELPPDTPWEIPYFRYKPNLRNARSGMGALRFNTNSLGFHSGEIAIPKPVKTFRILCVGGSTTEEGTEDGNYPKLLEKDLREMFPGKSIEVVNCGVSGMTTATHLLRLADYLKLEPDLLLLYEGINDIAHELVACWDSEKSIPAKLLTFSPFFKYKMNHLLFPPREQVARGLENLPIKNLHVLTRAAAEHGVRVAICGIASPDLDAMNARERAYLDYNARTFWNCRYLSATIYCQTARMFRDRLKEMCSRDGIFYIPVNEGIPGTLYYFTDFCHMWPWGIERKARVIADGLREYLRPALR